MTPPNLLNEDGSASMASLLLMSHHAFRRDISRFIRALEQVKAGDGTRNKALCEEWHQGYKQALHGHHTMEDTHIFPDIRNKHPELATALDTLTEQHHKIDPLLERGDMAFATLDQPEEAAAVLLELKRLLDEHLAYEEAEITPSLRDTADFPTPPDEETAAIYADGFAWSMHGINPEVLEQVKKMLPEILVAKLSEAQEKFELRCKEVWGEYAVGSATNSMPTSY